MIARLLLLAVFAFAGVAQAQMGPGPGAGAGPGAKGGCPGYHGGMGYGMGYGMGPGMMGPGMMGPGWGGGMGMMGADPLAGLNLTADQQKAVDRIVDQHRKQQQDLWAKSNEATTRLRDLYRQEKWDADAISKVYDQLHDLRKQMLRSRIQAHNQIQDQLTPEQRTQFRSMRHWWAE